MDNKSSHTASLTLVERLKCIFGLDKRSLAVLRVGTALLILFDLLIRSADLVAHYTDYGVFPRATILNLNNNTWHLSLHLFSGQWQFQAILFVVQAVFAIMLLVGYRTKLSTFFSWLLMISLHTRAPIILQSGDVLFRMMLFWAMFLPWGEYYSLDSVKAQLSANKNNLSSRFSKSVNLDSGITERESTASLEEKSVSSDKKVNSSGKKASISEIVVSGATIGYMAQLMIMYYFTAMLKTGAEWQTEFTAVYYALSIDQFSSPIGLFMLNFPDLLKLLTFVTIWMEKIAPFLLLIPIFIGQVRLLSIFSYIMLHMGFGICLYIGNFSWIIAVAWAAFIPTLFWDKIKERIGRIPKNHLTIYYDGACGICQKAVTIIKTFFILPYAKVLLASNNREVLLEMERKNSWIIEDHQGRHYFKFAGFQKLVEASPVLWPFRWVFKLKFVEKIGDWIYEKVAASRPRECKIETFKPPKNSVYAFSKKVFSTVFCLFVLNMVIMWNVTSLANSSVKYPESFRWISSLLRIDQNWAMFAPYPLKDDGWYVVVGKLQNGKAVDLLKNGGEVSWEKPALVSHIYKNTHWRKYLMNLWYKSYSAYRAPYLAYVCRNWNDNHPDEERLVSIEMNYMLETTLPDYQKFEPKRNYFAQWNCGN